jgi:hypothetical protein
MRTDREARLAAQVDVEDRRIDSLPFKNPRRRRETGRRTNRLHTALTQKIADVSCQEEIILKDKNSGRYNGAGP